MRYNDSLSTDEAKIKDPFNYGARNFQPRFNSPVLRGSIWYVYVPPAEAAFPVTFEVETDAEWSVFANSTGMDEDFMVVDNPAKTGINTSNKVLQFVVNDGADPWAGAFSDSYGPVEITSELNAFSMMVYKSIISPSGFKLESPTNGGAVTELKVSNSLTNQWELLTFDFNALVGFSYNRVTLFPDFSDPRTSGTTVYIDNISRTMVSAVSSNKVNSVKIYPNPVVDDLNVFLNQPNSKITIYNSVGSKIDELNVQGNFIKVDVSGYAHGMYYVKVNNDSVVKFIK
jgi:hypothetical protein